MLHAVACVYYMYHIEHYCHAEQCNLYARGWLWFWFDSFYVRVSTITAI